MARAEVRAKVREIKQRLLNIARAELGTEERGDNLTKYGEWYGLNGNPWCAMFISWVAWKGKALSIIPKHAYTPAGADYFKGLGRWGNTPHVGDIVYFDTAGLGRISHVGIVEKVFDDGSFYSIEGNTNAAGSREGTVVRRQKRTSVGPRGGFGTPEWQKLARKELGL